jgi:hypothetical protein
VTLFQLIDLGDNRVFKDAPDVYPAIHILKKSAPTNEDEASVVVFTRGDGLSTFESRIKSDSRKVNLSRQPNSGWRLDSVDSQQLMRKLLKTGVALSNYLSTQLVRGVLTGFNSAFIIPEAVRAQLISEDPSCASIIQPIVDGADVRPWFVSQQRQWLICTWQGTEIDAYPSIKRWLGKFKDQLLPRPVNWSGGNWNGRKAGSYKWYEIQDNVAFRTEFGKPKILYPELSKYPRFAVAAAGIIPNKTAFMIPDDDYYLLGILMSRVNWFAIQNLCQPIGERGGLLRYMLSRQFIQQLPIVQGDNKEISTLAFELTALGHERHSLTKQVSHRIQSDLAVESRGLNKALLQWWELDFGDFRREVKTALKREIPVRERSDWEHYMADARKSHEAYTADIVRMETELNAIVYTLFDLSPQEIKLIEESTKYRYGEI